jgi:competence protein ComEC
LLLGKNNSIHISIPFAAAVFVFVNPVIIFDVGFQLSILATLGLVYLAPSLENIFKEKNFIQKAFVKEYLLTTLSCTLATLPVSISTFGTFSIWSVFANILILPAVESTMLFGVLGIVLGTVIQDISRFFYLLTYIQLKYFELVVYLIQSFGFGIFEISGIMKNIIVILTSVCLFFLVLIYYPINNDGYNYYLKDIQKALD